MNRQFVVQFTHRDTGHFLSLSSRCEVGHFSEAKKVVYLGYFATDT